MIDNLFGQISLIVFGGVLCFGVWCTIEEAKEIFRKYKVIS